MELFGVGFAHAPARVVNRCLAPASYFCGPELAAASEMLTYCVYPSTNGGSEGLDNAAAIPNVTQV